ncbi:exported hypothetical protein [Mesorhizobium plurifarium]|uniref:Uncharacterized protein n=1 Tax=Mesorhizobium plurifarium TaxID=69974 RepID=A0A090G9N8_MESPL|nr:exported hypothetical protein [Mesorhizobium plurifarium]
MRLAETLATSLSSGFALRSRSAVDDDPMQNPRDKV